MTGIKLAEGDAVVAAVATGRPKRTGLLLVTAAGWGKRVPWEDFPRQKRHGAGVTAWPLPPKARLVAALAVRAREKDATRVTLFLRRRAAKAIRVEAAAWQTRRGRSAALLALPPGEEVTKVSRPQ